MIGLFTDFGWRGPYIGQMRAVLHQEAPGVPVFDLMQDAPICDPRRAAYLLEPFASQLPAGTVLLCIIDPGVGTEARSPVVLEAGGRWYVGPDNGLFELVSRRSRTARKWRIDWRPERLSNSFHGRDLFAPVAARIARGEAIPGTPIGDGRMEPTWPDDLAELLYIDHYGNVMTGLRGGALAPSTILRVGEMELRNAATFGAVPPGEPLWYVNSSGLVEVAVNQGRAADLTGVSIGRAVELR